MAGLHFFLISLETARTGFVPLPLTPSLSSTSVLLPLIFLEVVHLEQWKSFTEQTRVNPHNFCNLEDLTSLCNQHCAGSFLCQEVQTPLKSPGSGSLHQEIKSYPRICREKPLLFIFKVFDIGTIGNKKGTTRKAAQLYQNSLAKLLVF